MTNMWYLDYEADNNKETFIGCDNGFPPLAETMIAKLTGVNMHLTSKS